MPDETAKIGRTNLKWMPRELWDEVLEWCVIPTFDLVVELPGGSGIILVKRIIPPYENKWALPGLRMLKPEGIDDTLSRVASDEIGLALKLEAKRYLGQYVGRFKTEHQRQDISTGYAVPALSDSVRLNTGHFSDYRVIKDKSEVPANIGAMYKYYLDEYFSQRG